MQRKIKTHLLLSILVTISLVLAFYLITQFDTFNLKSDINQTRKTTEKKLVDDSVSFAEEINTEENNESEAVIITEKEFSKYKESESYLKEDIVVLPPKGDEVDTKYPDFLNTENKREEYYKNKAEYNGQFIKSSEQ